MEITKLNISVESNANGKPEITIPGARIDCHNTAKAESVIDSLLRNTLAEYGIKRSRRTRVYIAGPLTNNGNIEENVRNACKAATELNQAGYACLCPHLTAYMAGPVACPSAGLTHEEWMQVDLPFVQVCDALLRLPGHSEGADMEVDHAIHFSVPVFHSVKALIDLVPKQKTSR